MLQAAVMPTVTNIRGMSTTCTVRGKALLCQERIEAFTWARKPSAFDRKNGGQATNCHRARNNNLICENSIEPFIYENMPYLLDEELDNDLFSYRAFSYDLQFTDENQDEAN